MSDSGISINASLISSISIAMKRGLKCGVRLTYTYPADFLPQSHR